MVDHEGLDWKKSSRSLTPNNACVEVARTDDAVYVRDSKDPRGAILTFVPEVWRAFVEAVIAGEFDHQA